MQKYSKRSQRARANCMRATSAAQATTPGRLELAGAGELAALLTGSFTSRSAPHTPTVVSASSIIGNSTSTPAASWSRPIERPMLRAVSFMILNFKQHVKIYLFRIHGCRGRVTTRARLLIFVESHDAITFHNKQIQQTTFALER